jgi:hypothetical protein
VKIKNNLERFRSFCIILAIGGVAVVLAVFVTGVNWLVYPHVTLTIFNVTSTAIRDVRISLLYRERTAGQIEPGGNAKTEIQSGGESGVFFSYRDSNGILRKDEPIYYSDSTASPDRGFLEVHVSDKGTRLVKNIYNFDFDISSPPVRVKPTGRMTVN